ncbi:ABC transporter ATP-binding protein [Aquisalimonas asiatica]|uniref:ABC-2 type transport system ATP-binding protein n=1 Tax=Aquisalimonas asiatica TaxID=406100 RepID=A0A1H8U9F5_9GAMM|nr:ABC transporter ATP-binding protein [Aquisalimonas asiatica]SEO99831.1 ABC-2 type transport system ATP-binding protein [Aquisalimonas asiatica]
MSAPAIALEGLTKHYASGRTGLAGVDLTVDAGRFFGLLGPNGAGKTTLIGLLTSLVRLEQGTVRVFGHDLAREPVAARRLIGLVPQEVNFNSFEPVAEIVATQAAYYGLSPRRARQRTDVVLSLLGLADRARQTAWGLSGGLKRRLMIARALAHEPRLLVLDEPTAGVDVAARHDLWAVLQRLNAAGTTVLLTTHYLEEAEQLCDDLAFIDDGRLIARGSPTALLQGMDHDTLVLDLAADCPEPPRLDGVTVRAVDSRTLEVDVPRGRHLNTLFASLTEAGVQVISLRNKSNRLEQLFLERLRSRQEAPA